MPPNTDDSNVDFNDLRAVRVAGFDLDGVLRGKYISPTKFRSALEDGFGFCDVIFGWDCNDQTYDKCSFTGWQTGFPDLLARIVPKSLRQIPWEAGAGFALAEFHKRDGAPLPFCPRQLLKKVLARVEAAGYAPRMAAEYEFFLFEETPESLVAKGWAQPQPESPGNFCYSLLRVARRAELVHALLDGLAGLGVEVEGLHTETGPGAFEAAIRYGETLAAADNAGLFKHAVKEICARHGLLASFMAKWSADQPGCGGHVHQSLVDPESGRNLFAEPDGEYGCSQLARAYLAGQQRYLPELMPLICPTINSYKRLVPGFWAPTQATWGVENRTNALRFIPGASAKSTRIETRIAGADASPHLAFAACLASGLAGIEQRLEPTPPTRGNAYAESNAPALPRSLSEATARLRASSLARDWFGEEFVEHLCQSREWECRQFDQAVTDWERKRYFEII